MPKKVEEMMYILSPSRAYLSPARIMGPIVHPLKISRAAVIELLMNGAEVYEFIPKTKKTIKLTLGNINDKNRYNNKAEEDVTKVSTGIEPVISTGVQITSTEKPDDAKTESEISTEELSTVDNIAAEDGPISFEYNEDGTVDESKIDWSSYSKNQRKEIRSKINENNAALAK